VTTYHEVDIWRKDVAFPIWARDGEQLEAREKQISWVSRHPCSMKLEWSSMLRTFASSPSRRIADSL
jgi:hypothetical protein